MEISRARNFLNMRRTWSAMILYILWSMAIKVQLTTRMRLAYGECQAPIPYRASRQSVLAWTNILVPSQSCQVTATDADNMQPHIWASGQYCPRQWVVVWSAPSHHAVILLSFHSGCRVLSRPCRPSVCPSVRSSVRPSRPRYRSTSHNI